MRSSTARRRQPRLPYNHGEPIWRCRYDVIAGALFVLFVAITAMPLTQIRAHALVIDLPTPAYDQFLGTDGLPKDETSHLIAPQADGSIEWDGERVSEVELLERIQAALARPILPEILLTPDANASYESSLRVVAILRLAGADHFCFGELEIYRSFGKGEALPRLSLTLIGDPISPPPPLMRGARCTSNAIIAY